MRKFLLLLLSSLSPVLAGYCTRVEACAAKLSVFPQVEEVRDEMVTSSSQDGSGWGSGMVPLYDELLETIPFDYSQEPETQEYSLCECRGNTSCDPTNETRNVKLDGSVQLTFCEDASSQLAYKCQGARAKISIIGSADTSGKFISSISQTLVFCSCPNGYQRMAPQVWQGNQLYVQYNCL